GMRQVQKEYPPVIPESKKTRGRYDISVFDKDRIASVDWWTHWRANGTARGTPVAPTVAIEIGLNKGVSQDPNGTEGRLSDIDKELGRLTDGRNGLELGLLVYLYRYATHDRPAMLRIVELVKARTRQFEHPNLTLVAVGFDQNKGYSPIEYYELHVRNG